jgi:hypothetical protein
MRRAQAVLLGGAKEDLVEFELDHFEVELDQAAKLGLSQDGDVMRHGPVP